MGNQAKADDTANREAMDLSIDKGDLVIGNLSRDGLQRLQEKLAQAKNPRDESAPVSLLAR